jgi:hypothetical protein
MIADFGEIVFKPKKQEPDVEVGRIPTSFS